MFINKTLLLVPVGLGVYALSTVGTFAASVSGTTVNLDSADIQAVASSYSGLGTSILNFITDIGPVAVPLVAALWIG